MTEAAAPQVADSEVASPRPPKKRRKKHRHRVPVLGVGTWSLPGDPEIEKSPEIDVSGD